MPPTIQQQRDNLTIGLFLAHGIHGATLEQILQVPLGYIPDGNLPVTHFDRSFREAQRVGREAFKERRSGYFTFNAMSFGGRYIYKATWYVWENPQSGHSQTVPLFAGDLAAMERQRSKDLRTRTATARSISAADNIHEQQRAIQANDWTRLHEIQARMIDDGSLGEILSGFHGLPYADIQEVIEGLGHYPAMFQFQKDAKEVRKFSYRLKKAEADLSQRLMSWVMLQTGVPNNAPELALQQAERRLAEL